MTAIVAGSLASGECLKSDRACALTLDHWLTATAANKPLRSSLEKLYGGLRSQSAHQLPCPASGPDLSTTLLHCLGLFCHVYDFIVKEQWKT